jgi:hypothetical protein
MLFLTAHIVNNSLIVDPIETNNFFYIYIQKLYAPLARICHGCHGSIPTLMTLLLALALFTVEGFGIGENLILLP